MAIADSPLLLLNSISKSYGGVRALDHVSFQLNGGEVHALIGENGAGKSTLIRIITGAHAPDSGTLQFDGQIIEQNNPRKAKMLGISAIYQQPALFPDLTVMENIALRLEENRAWSILNWKKRRARAVELLDRVGAEFSPDALVRQLSMPQQQLLEIAGSMGANARLMILDEPTASLGDREVHKLFTVIRQLKAHGVGIIYISHRLEELSQIADRVTVLRDGKTIATRSMRDVDRAELVRLIVGREVSNLFPKIDVPLGQTLLEARNLGCAEVGVQGINLSVQSGEILAIAGLVGAGRTELARILFGLTPADEGEILLRGIPVRIDSPAQAIRLGIAYVPEDRRRHGVILEMSVAANTTLAILRQICNFGLIDFDKEHQIATDFVQRLGTKVAGVNSAVEELSGGNQQKVALARWLATKPAVIILDEPTQGVDVGAKSEIHRLMGELAKKGLAIIMISSELTEVLGMADRIVVMHGGRISGILPRSAATQESILEMALGHGIAEEIA